MIRLVADGTDEQAVPLLARVALLAEHAVVAEPAILDLLLPVLEVLGVRQTVRVERFATEVAAEEVLLIAKGPAQVAHLLEDQSWVLEADFDWV